MKQIRHIRVTYGGGVNSSLYSHPFIPVATTSTIESSATCSMPVAGTIRNLSVRLFTAPGTGKSHTIRFKQGGTASALSVTVADSALTGSDTSDSLTIAANDTLVIDRIGSGFPPGTIALITFEWEPTTANTSVYGFGGPTDTISAATARTGIFDDGSSWDGSAAAAATLIGLAGNITGYRIVLNNAPGGGNTRTFTLWKNGVAQDGSGGTPDTRLTFNAADTTLGTTFTLAVASGDRVYIEHTSTGTPATTDRVIGVASFVSTTANRWHVGMTTDDLYEASTVDYHYHSGSTVGSGSWDATEADVQHGGGVTTYFLGEMIARLAVAPGAGKSVTFTLRVNGANTTQTLTISGTDTSGATTGAVADIPTTTALISVMSVPSGTPTSTNSIPKISWWGTDVSTAIRGSAVFGEHTTVTANRAIAFGLDGATNTHSDEGMFKVFGDVHITGDLTVDGASGVDLSASLDALGT